MSLQHEPICCQVKTNKMVINLDGREPEGEEEKSSLTLTKVT